jgi:hypothetical protein
MHRAKAAERTVVRSPRKAELTFLDGHQALPLLSGLFCFLVGTVVLYKKGSDERSLVLFTLCSFYFSSAVDFVEHIRRTIETDPQAE